MTESNSVYVFSHTGSSNIMITQIIIITNYLYLYDLYIYCIYTYYVDIYIQYTINIHFILKCFIKEMFKEMHWIDKKYIFVMLQIKNVYFK